MSKKHNLPKHRKGSRKDQRRVRAAQREAEFSQLTPEQQDKMKRERKLAYDRAHGKIEVDVPTEVESS